MQSINLLIRNHAVTINYDYTPGRPSYGPEQAPDDAELEYFVKVDGKPFYRLQKLVEKAISDDMADEKESYEESKFQL